MQGQNSHQEWRGDQEEQSTFPLAFGSKVCNRDNWVSWRNGGGYNWSYLFMHVQLELTGSCYNSENRSFTNTPNLTKMKSIKHSNFRPNEPGWPHITWGIHNQVCKSRSCLVMLERDPEGFYLAEQVGWNSANIQQLVSGWHICNSPQTLCLGLYDPGK